MKNKISKIFLAIFSIFLLAGSGIFSACENEQPQATIEVSSTDFAGDDYIEIDLGSDVRTATLTAKVSGVSAGIVSVNNDHKGIIATSAVYDSKTESTLITIVGKSEGDVQIVLKSHGKGDRPIRVYVYSDITSLDQTDNEKDRYVVRGQANTLVADTLLKFGSRKDGESNRKDVTWSLKTLDSKNLSLDGNVLTVGEEYQKNNSEAIVEVYADSVYVDKRATVTLHVISPLPDYATYISRTSDSQGVELSEAGMSFNLVKNDDSNEESILYARLVVPVASKLDVSPKVYSSAGIEVKDKLDVTHFNTRTLADANEIIYKITAKTDNIDMPEQLTVCFDVSYEEYSYSKESTRFIVNLVDVIDRIDVKSNGMSLTKGDTINIYDYYNNDSSFQFGHPFVVSLGPDTVANSLAKYYVDITVPTGKAINGLVLLSDQYGSSIKFAEKISSTALGDTYRSEAIDNKTTIYLIAGNAFDNGDELGCKFVSQQTERVDLSINLRLYNSPKENFNLDGGELQYYLSTNKYDSKHIEVSSTALMGIDKAGVKLGYAENDKISLNNFKFDSENGKISFDVTNNELNIDEDDAKLSIRVEHSNGFVSMQEIVIVPFIPLKSAYVNYKGQTTTAISHTQYGTQDFYKAAEEYSGLSDKTLTKLIMKAGSSVGMNFVSNCDADVEFKLIGVLNFDDLENDEIIDKLTNATEITDSGITNPVNNDGILTMPSQDVKYFVLVSFSGYDEKHEDIVLYRYFYLEGYTAPTRLISNIGNDQSLELYALDSVSFDEKNLSTKRITIKYRSDNKPITYWQGQTDGGSMVGIASTWIQGANDYWEVDSGSFVCTDSIISFDILAKTTGGRDHVTSQAVVCYQIFNTIYSVEIDFTIKNAQRVERVVYTNQNPDDGIIYLDLYGSAASEKSAVILTSVEPSKAYNKQLDYIFVADDGTQADLVSVSELGIASFKNGTTRGGAGYIYVLPKDAIRDIDGVKGILYYKEGNPNKCSLKLSELGSYYDEICSNNYYFLGSIDTSTYSREKVYYKDIILKIRIVVADGEDEGTAIRIYSELGLKTLQSNKHYELMNSIDIGSEWESISLGSGSLRGHNGNILINFNGSAPLFDTIGAGAKVKDLILTGSVKGSGMLAETNKGTIQNIKVTVNSDDDGNIQIPKVTGTGYVGGIVGINEGSIQSSSVEGTIITAGVDSNNFVGGIAGKNTGTISDGRVEFYKISEDNVNTFGGYYVGGIVGYLYDGGKVEGSYAYNYSSIYPLNGTKTGAFAGKALGTDIRIHNSFAILAGTDNMIDGSNTIVAIGEDGEEKKDDRGDIYYANMVYVYAVYWGYGVDFEDDSNSSTYWVPTTGNTTFASYVRNGERHLSFYQAQAISSSEMNAFVVKDVVDSENDITKALAIDETSGILFISALKDSSSLTDGERSYLHVYNTISIADLLGIGASDIGKVVVSSSSKDIEISGSNIILLGKSSEVKIKLSSKYNFTLSKEFTFEIVYALDQLTIWRDGVETLGFTLQEGRTSSVLLTIKDSIYLGNSREAFKIKIEDYEVKTSIDPVVDDDKNVIDGKITFNADVTSATLLAQSGTKDALAKAGEESFNANVWIEIKGFDNNELIKAMTQKTLQIYPTKGSQYISVSVEDFGLVPAYQSEFEVVLVTDDENDELLLTLKFGDVVMTQNRGIFSIGDEQRIKIDVARTEYKDNQFKYTLTVSVCDDYKHKISAEEEYVLLLSSKTGTATNEGREVVINLSMQSINNIDIANYESGTTIYKNGTVTYTRKPTSISVISPGRNSMMQVSIDPTFAHYEYMTLTYQNADGAVLGITALNAIGDEYSVDGTAANVEHGVKLARNENGEFNFRIYAAANIITDTVFNIVASFYGKDGKLVAEQAVYDLYVSYLPEAEITINGDISALVAKGGSLDIVMLLKSDQDIDSISASNVKGISISPKSTWTIEDNGNGTKTVYAKLYAGLNAAIIKDENYVNGEFEVTAVVSRIFNGAREEKRSSAFVTIVEFLPESAQVKNATEKDGVKVLDTYIGIPVAVDFEYSFIPEEYGYDQSNKEEIELFNQLSTARAAFQDNKYYHDDSTGFSINYRDEQIVPIYERIKIGNQKIKFVKSSTDENVWIFNYSKFRLSYNEKTGVMTVLGVSSTASPITLTLVDEISVASSGKAIKYTIETQFAIDVVTYSDPDMPLTIKDEVGFLKVAEEGKAQSYILLNDITLKNYTPFSAEMFAMLDGNGYSINIESFNTEGSGTLNLALFTNVPKTTTIKNLKINYYNGGKIDVDTTSAGYSTINVAGVAINNAGIITNTQVIAYQNADAEIVETDSVGLKVNLLRGSTPYYIDDNSSVKSQIAGFVIENSGSITNSRVGGDSIIVIGDQIEANYTYYTNEELDQFVLSGQGDMAGFVISNTGSIVASGASNIQITNLSTSTKTSTAGFVVTNSANIGTSYVEGSADESEATQYHLTGSSISARGTVAGFVVNNAVKGVIENAYSNIFISNANTTQSRTSAGFVYSNIGSIAYSYSASKVEKANILQSNFSGVDANGNSLNEGKIELSYYYIADYADDSSEDIQELVENQASRINKDAVDSQNSYYGFIFSSSASTQDGIWEIDTDTKEGVKLICRNEVTISHRYYQAISEDEYALPYSILKDKANTTGTEYNTELGNDCNPILISSAKEFKEAMGESKSVYVKKFYNSSKVWGSYRFVADISLSDLNNELGNAEVSSIDKVFAGKLDGNGFAIKNISIKSSNDSVGLFGEINNGVVVNLDIEVDNITASDSYTVGTLSGLVKNSVISNISLTQKTVSDGTSGRGVLGRNITGGIIGSVFGDCYITGLSAQDVIVQSSYYFDRDGRVKTYLGIAGESNVFSANAVREYENQMRTKFFSDNGIGSYSFAGSLIGYSDTYLTNEYSSLAFVYNQNLSDSQYAIKKLSVRGSIDVRGEIVGGAIGFTGVNTKAKDINLVLSKGDGKSNSILSYNGLAGTIVGYANGQFHQVYAEHDEDTQDKIESLTNDYYAKGTTSVERGELQLFKFKEASTGSYKYDPVYVGGLMGAMNSGAITVSYSKINAINYTDGGYAGGIAGYVNGSTQYNISVDALGQTAKTTLYLNEVYASGDVYAKGGFAGLFGELNDAAKLTMMSVNAVNYYGMAIENNKADGIFAIASNASADNVNVYPAAVATDGLSQADLNNAKSFGYMRNYSTKDKSFNVWPYKDYSSDPAFFFQITAVSSFTSPASGYTETNAAFINSGSWDSDNWTHKITDLYPTINLVNKPNYIYLDVYNKVSVVAKMQNSSIEVRVRGKVSPNEDRYESVDLTDVVGENGIVGFSGKIVGGVDSSWGSQFGIIQLGTFGGKAVNGYPGIKIKNVLFNSLGSGASVSDLNIIVDGEEIKSTNGLISQQGLIRGKFENVSLYINNPITVEANKISNFNAGLLVPSAQSSSFKNITFNFYAQTDPAVKFVNTANAGLLAGEILQNSRYEAVKIQEITTKQADASVQLMSVEKEVTATQSTEGGISTASVGDSQTINVGLYVGYIHSNESSAGVVLTAKAPETWATDGIGDNFESKIVVGGKVSALNFGGYYGLVESPSTTLTFTKSVSGAQTLTLVNQSEQMETKILNEGGLIGNASLQGLTFLATNGESDSAIINTNLEFSTNKQSNANAGLLFGTVQGSFSIENTLGGIVGKIYTTNSTISGSIGGLIGENNATLIINDLAVSINNGGTLKADNVGFAETTPNGLALDGNSYVGGFIGKNVASVVTASSIDKLKFNSDGENVALSGSTIYYGDFIGFNNNKAEINSFTSNSMTYINAETVSVGGVVGYSQTTADTTIGGDSVSINVASNYFIDNPLTLNAGGIIGQIVASDNTSGAYTIQNTALGGAFKVVGVTGGTHYVGGTVGKIGENISSVTINDNAIYGDAIYTYSGNGQLANYYFGGVVGSSDTTPTIKDNIIAFTNNNSRKASSKTSVNAVAGNNDSLGADNYYSSQVVLATNDNATDLGYKQISDKGYGKTDKTGSIIEKLTNKLKDIININNLTYGHKLKPITSGSESKTSNLNGIAYYTEKYPASLKNNTLTNAAFIGDFNDIASNGYTPIKTVGQHAFVSGVVVGNNISDTSTIEFSDSIGGIAKELCDGIIFACKATGTLSIGGETKVNVGGIVGLMQTGRIAECYSAVDIVYRAASGGTAAGIAVTSAKMSDGTTAAINYIEKSYSTGVVGSYISANLYAFTNGVNTCVNDSYTISLISAKDHTSYAESTGTFGIFGSATCTNCSYDKDATEYTNNIGNGTAPSDTVPNVTYEDGKTLTGLPSGKTDLTSGWVADMDNNYGYMRRNFKAFEVSSFETITVTENKEVTYYLVPNLTKFLQMKNDSTNYKLIHDIDISKTSKASGYSTLDLGRLGTFDGDGHTVSNNNATLFSFVGTLKNLRVEGYMNDNTGTGITGSAVVAKSVHIADNVVATGLLNQESYNGSIGGLFAEVTCSATNCKNYVKIDIKEVAGYIGGIAGSGVAATNCFNYGPINLEESEGRAAGIYGYAIGAVTKCGNENSVFSGYTNTESDDNYYAAGIVGFLNNYDSRGEGDASISNCYNTGMIKAGNKNINKNEDSSTNAAYAAGIVAANAGGSVSDCYNAGFIEALGSMEKAAYSISKVSIDGGKYKLTFEYNTGEIMNVCAGSIIADGNNGNSSAYCFQNGLYGGKQATIEFAVPENNSGTINGITIEDTEHTAYVAAYDEMGVPEEFFIKTTRSLNYGGKITRGQTRYTKTNGFTNLTNYSKAKAAARGVGMNTVIKTDGAGGGSTVSLGSNSYYRESVLTPIISYDSTVLDKIDKIREEAASDESPAGDTVKISEKSYMFASNGAQFNGAMKCKTYTTTVTYNSTIGGKTIKELYEAGYDFTVTGTGADGSFEATADGNTITEITDINQTVSYVVDGNGALKITFQYNSTLTESKENVSIGYKIAATKAQETVEFTLSGSNIVNKDGETVIVLSNDIAAMLRVYGVSGAYYTVKIADTVYSSKEFVYDQDNNYLIYQGDKNYNTLVGDLNGKTITIDVYEHYYYTSESKTHIWTSDSGTPTYYNPEETTFNQQSNTYSLGTTFTYSNEYSLASATGLVKSTTYNSVKKTVLYEPNEEGVATQSEVTTQLKMSHQVNGYVSKVTFGGITLDKELQEIESFSCGYGDTTSVSGILYTVEISNWEYENNVTSFDIIASWKNPSSDSNFDNAAAGRIDLFKNAQITIEVAYQNLEALTFVETSLPFKRDGYTIDNDYATYVLKITTEEDLSISKPDESDTSTDTKSYITTYTWTVTAKEGKNLVFKYNDRYNDKVKVILADDTSRSFTMTTTKRSDQTASTVALDDVNFGTMSACVYVCDLDKYCLYSNMSDNKITFTDSGTGNVVYVYGSQSVSLAAGAEDRTVTFDYSADVTEIKKYYYEGDDTTTISISDNKIIITDTNSNSNVIYKYNGGYASIAAGAEDRKVAFNYSAGVTEIIKYKYDYLESSNSIELTVGENKKLDEFALTKLVPVLVYSETFELTHADGKYTTTTVDGATKDVTFTDDKTQCTIDGITYDISSTTTTEDVITSVTVNKYYTGVNGILNIEGTLIAYAANSANSIVYYLDGEKLIADANGNYVIKGKKYREGITYNEVGGEYADGKYTTTSGNFSKDMVLSYGEMTKQAAQWEKMVISVGTATVEKSGFVKEVTINKTFGLTHVDEKYTITVDGAEEEVTFNADKTQCTIDGKTYDISSKTTTAEGVITSITVKINDSSNIDATNGTYKETFTSTSNNETNYEITVIYEQFELVGQSAKFTHTANKQGYDGIVLKNDIDLGYLSALAIGANISGDGKIVNFVGLSAGLFDNSASQTTFFKNVNFAGSVLSATAGGIIHKGTLTASLVNVATYGTVSNVSGRKLLTESLGGMGNELNGTNNENLRNFASVTNFVGNGFYQGTISQLCGIATSFSKKATNLTNYGVVIGCRGADGISGSDGYWWYNDTYNNGATGLSGYDGQNVYAISNSASNITSANSYGILKAGDGGNGGRGGDGLGGSDSKYSWHAPQRGTYGGYGGSKGEAGKAYGCNITTDGNYFAEVTESNSYITPGTDGKVGTHGNDGWGGLSLAKFDNRFSGDNKGENFAQTLIYTHAGRGKDAGKITVGLKVKKIDGVWFDGDTYVSGNLYCIEIRYQSSRLKEIYNIEANQIFYTYIKWNLWRPGLAADREGITYQGSGDERTCIQGYYIGDQNNITSAIVYYK